MKYLFRDNNILFDKCYQDKNILIGIRVQIIDVNSIYYDKLGEIERNDGDKYLVKISNNLYSFAENDTYEKIYLEEYQFEKIDMGINSPYNIDIQELIKLL